MEENKLEFEKEDEGSDDEGIKCPECGCQIHLEWKNPSEIKLN